MLVLTPLHKAGKLEATSGAEFSYVSMGCDQSHGQKPKLESGPEPGPESGAKERGPNISAKESHD
jgi:hypothetical protein